MQEVREEGKLAALFTPRTNLKTRESVRNDHISNKADTTPQPSFLLPLLLLYRNYLPTVLPSLFHIIF